MLGQGTMSGLNQPFLAYISGRDLWQWRCCALAEASNAQISPAEVDWLLQGLCQVDALSLRLGSLASQTEVASRVSLAHLQTLWQQRVVARVPIQHLVGQTTWRNFTLEVSPAVLIPRPETELIVEGVLEAVNSSPAAEHLRRGTWVDLGTGSGAIALALAECFPAAEVLAVDMSAAALAVAQRNAARAGVSDRICFCQGSWFEPLGQWRGQLAGMVSNPPYIPSDTILTLQPEVLNHEPHLALDGGEDGLKCIRELIQIAPEFLYAQGIWMVELMLGQAPTVMQMLEQTGQYQDIRSYRDLARIERFVRGRVARG